MDFLIKAKHEDNDGCAIHLPGAFIPTLLVSAASAQEAMEKYYDEAEGFEVSLSYIVHTIEIKDTDEFRFEISLEQKVKDTD